MRSLVLFGVARLVSCKELRVTPGVQLALTPVHFEEESQGYQSRPLEAVRGALPIYPGVAPPS
jgi:hypothetical protein